MEQKKRIEYIDALRGFTMILVVYSHIQIFSLPENNNFTFNSIFYLFIMPLFFFISGFILYNSTKIWNRKFTYEFLYKKFLVQIIPTIIFISFFALCFKHNIRDILITDMKYGYWFTFTLFEFFLVFSLLKYLVFKFKIDKYENIILIGTAITLYILRSDCFIVNFDYTIFHTLGMKHWHYFFYFVMGCLIKKYFLPFQKLLENKYFSSFIVVSFFTAAIIYVNHDFYDKILKLYIAIAGIIFVFSYFRKYSEHFNKDRKAGYILQYIGRRTLDIYLIHYFLLPTKLFFLSNILNDANPIVEFVISSTLAVIIIIFCLFFSSALRINPLLSRYLFGVKQ